MTIFGRRLQNRVKDNKSGNINILFDSRSTSGTSKNITVGADPVIISAFGLTGDQTVKINNVFRNVSTQMFYRDEAIELSATNTVVMLAFAGVYNLETDAVLGGFTVIAYTDLNVDRKDLKSTEASNPAGEHEVDNNLFFDGSAGQVYSREFIVGRVPQVFRAYGLDTQTIELQAIFRDSIETVNQDNEVVGLTDESNTLVISVAGKYRLKLVGDSTGVTVLVRQA
jgi:hypothetical protein